MFYIDCCHFIDSAQNMTSLTVKYVHVYCAIDTHTHVHVSDFSAESLLLATKSSPYSSVTEPNTSH